jgi:transposase-like protein
MLDAGASVRDVARDQDVSTQAIYKRIEAGHLARPEGAR